MPQHHPELEAEQAYLDHAYECLEAARAAAIRLTDISEAGPGGTSQARFERDVLYETVAGRLSQLDLGSRSLVFGRIDYEGGERFYIGRLGIWDRERDIVVVDWRAPVAEAFYRATGREPLGLERRRHFSTRGRTLLAIEDELFGDLSFLDDPVDGRPRVQGEGALIAALETARTGRLSDIVATIQAEQDDIIRAPMPGVLVVQGGPGTGKTVVALHRAAYLLYTHRFPLEGQGVLVIGPNRLFLAYIEQVLPSLGEAGVEQSVLADLVANVRVDGRAPENVGRVKGDLRMVPFIERAVRDRERPLLEDLRVGYGVQSLWFTVEQSQRVVRDARRRFRTHNGARKFVESELFTALAASAREEINVDTLRDRLRDNLDVRRALERMWPVLAPAQLLHDLFGSKALIRSAARKQLTEREVDLLHRPRVAHPDKVVWTDSDVALLDEARELLGARPGKRDIDSVRTYGHIVVDEAQDLSPMDLRVLSRRSLSGSMTVVGDIAQSTGAWAHTSWDEILEHLPDRRPPRTVELTVGYRIPAPLVTLAARVLREAAPQLKPPISVRQDGSPPRIVRVATITDGLIDVVRDELAEVEQGNVALVCPASLVDDVCDALGAAGVPYGRATRRGFDQQVTVVAVGMVKGLEVDSAIVVEPARIVSEEAQGMRALYVALTRATKRLTVVYAEPLPAVLAE
ncbi:MAG TPA: DNA/RNA helicase domain-containing protein [Acidimicrobiales bacterium]|nr:DNA/RNA helicase domain-containing protein [Acidimicrobiales bacterium]